MLFWAYMAFVTLACVASFLAGAIVFAMGTRRRSLPIALAGLFIIGLSCFVATPPVVAWLNQFGQWNIPIHSVKLGLEILAAALAVIFIAMVVSALIKRRK
jgi:hypothetical protein